MTPEAKARQQIDQKLEQAGWVIQDMKQPNAKTFSKQPSPANLSCKSNDEPASVLLERLRAERVEQSAVKKPQRKISKG